MQGVQQLVCYKRKLTGEIKVTLSVDLLRNTWIDGSRTNARVPNVGVEKRRGVKILI